MAEHAHEDHSGFYLRILGILTVLTVLTVLLSSKVGIIEYGDMRLLAVAVAFVIAVTKASLVALYFMHLKYEDIYTWIFVIFPIFLIALMMGGILIDNPLRDDVRPVEVNNPLLNEPNQTAESEQAPAEGGTLDPAATH